MIISKMAPWRSSVTVACPIANAIFVVVDLAPEPTDVPFR
jgi:hypothetical protein